MQIINWKCLITITILFSEPRKKRRHARKVDHQEEVEVQINVEEGVCGETEEGCGGSDMKEQGGGRETGECSGGETEEQGGGGTAKKKRGKNGTKIRSQVYNDC